MISRSARLLLRVTVPAVLAVWMVFLFINLLTVFTNEVGEIGTGDYSLAAAIGYTLLNAPRVAYEMLPYGMIVGVLIGLGQLAGHSELIALQAVGASRGRIAAVVMAGMSCLTLLVMYGAETLGSTSVRMANALASQAKHEQGLSIGTSSGLWMRDGVDIINAATIATNNTGMPDLWNVRIYRFGALGSLESVISARTAHPNNSGWELRNVTSKLLGEQIQTVQADTLQWPSSLRADLIASRSLRPRQQSINELSASIAYAKANNLADQVLVSAFWYRVSFPFNVIALALLALPFAFGNLRSGGFGKRVFLGMLLGLSFFFVQRTIANLFETLDWNLAVGHLLPSILIACFGMWLLKGGAAR
jgi:lipopolysaccharide export system permease protein